jgi:hypothetical protein
MSADKINNKRKITGDKNLLSALPKIFSALFMNRATKDT